MYGNAADREWQGKRFARDRARQAMPKTCPSCGASKTNVGHLKHYGYYTGYACRTIYLDGERTPFKQSFDCRVKGVLKDVEGYERRQR